MSDEAKRTDKGDDTFAAKSRMMELKGKASLTPSEREELAKLEARFANKA